MENDAAHHVHNVVALLCPEPRLHRLLRLALEAGGFCIHDSPAETGALTGPISAVVADLDSLRWHPRIAPRQLLALGIDSTVPRLFICVLPSEPAQHNASTSAYLQPPFAPREFVHRLQCLLDT